MMSYNFVLWNLSFFFYFRGLDSEVWIWFVVLYKEERIEWLFDFVIFLGRILEGMENGNIGC